jgi:hypothetical protein
VNARSNAYLFRYLCVSLPPRQEIWLGVVRAGPFQLQPAVIFFAAHGSLMVSKTIRIPKL